MLTANIDWNTSHSHSMIRLSINHVHYADFVEHVARFPLIRAPEPDGPRDAITVKSIPKLRN